MNYTLLVVFTIFTAVLSAQEFSVPENLVLETEADYLAQNDNIVAAVEWLRDTHVNNESKKRKRVNTYLLEWLTGTPTMTISLNANIIDYGECADCLMLYMGGYAKTVIENGNPTDVLAANVGAIEVLIDFYQTSKGRLGKIKSIEKFIKLKEKGKLEAAIAKKLT